LRWWGWGEDDGATALPEAAAALLRSELGLDGSESSPRVPLEEVELPDPALTAAARRSLEAAVGEEGVSDDREARVTHAAGKGYADLVRVRAGDGSNAPDAVVAPG
jgi:alkyldihydroxyacetonephosphate synthase